MVYSGEKWTQNEPLNYYNKVRVGRHFHADTEALLLRFLETIKDNGLDEFHKMARCEGEYTCLKVAYDHLAMYSSESEDTELYEKSY